MSVIATLVCTLSAVLVPQVPTPSPPPRAPAVQLSVPRAAPAPPAAAAELSAPGPARLVRDVARVAERRARARAVFARQAELAARADAPSAPGSAHPRNVLVVMLDDVGIDRLASYEAVASQPATTPFLDVVAEQSLVFDRAYAQPVCSPSRMGALTGLRPTRTGVGTVFLWDNTAVDPYNVDLRGLATLPRQVSATRTHVPVAVGKWHMNNLAWTPNPFTHPIEFGFHEFRGSMTSVLLDESYYDYPYTVATQAGAHTAQETTYATTLQIDDALDVVERLGKQPFVMWLSLHAPHTPWEPPPAELISVDPGSLGTDNQLYQASLEAADTELLRFFEALRPAVLARTVVVIVGDNGTPATSFDNPQNLPFNGYKGSVGERGVHVPMFVWAADGVTGRTPALTHTDDLYATTLELIGGDAGPGLDSVSFAPVIFGADGARDHVYVARHRPNGAGPYELDMSAVIRDKWKLQRDTEGVLRLFLLNAPPNNQLWRQPPFTPNEQVQFDELKALLEAIEA